MDVSAKDGDGKEVPPPSVEAELLASAETALTAHNRLRLAKLHRDTLYYLCYHRDL